MIDSNKREKKKKAFRWLHWKDNANRLKRVSWNVGLLLVSEKTTICLLTANREKERKERKRGRKKKREWITRGGRELLQRLRGGGVCDCGTLIQCVCSHVRNSPEIVTTHGHSAGLVFAAPSTTDLHGSRNISTHSQINVFFSCFSVGFFTCSFSWCAQTASKSLSGIWSLPAPPSPKISWTVAWESLLRKLPHLRWNYSRPAWR